MNMILPTIRIHRTLLALTLLPFLAPPLKAQGPSAEGSTFFESVNVNIVNVEVFVTDRKGNPISDLGREDFRLMVDGTEVPIANFYAQADGRPVDRGLPVDSTTPIGDTFEASVVPIEQRLHLVIFIDNLHLRAVNRKKTFKHLREFLDTHLGQNDRVTVVSQNTSLFIHNDFLSDRVALNDILDEVQKMATQSFSGEATRRRLFQEIGHSRTSLRQESDPDGDQALLSEIRAYAQTEFSLATSSIDSLERLLLTLGGIKGRKAMLHVSDGITNRPGEGIYEAWNDTNFNHSSSYERTIGSFDLLPRFRQLGRTANASGVTFYAIDAESDHTAIGRSAAMAGGEGGILPSQVIEMLSNNPRETLELTAQTTGGRRVQRTPQLAENLGRLANDFGSFYSLGFRAEDRSDVKKNHRIEVKVVGKGLRVRHRETYRAQNRDDQSGDFAMAALLYNAVDNPLGVSLEVSRVQERDDGTFMLTVLVKIPVGNLVLLPQGATHSAQLSFFVSVKGRGGDPRPVQKIPFYLPIPADQVEEARSHEAAYPLALVIRPGDLQAVVGVRDDYASQESVVRLDLDRWAGVPVEKKRRKRTSP
jgi:VWFA-related protein